MQGHVLPDGIRVIIRITVPAQMAAGVVCSYISAQITGTFLPGRRCFGDLQPLMERLCDFLIDNISNQTSTRSVAAAFTGEQVKTNDRTISAYIKYLCNAFAFYKVRRYDIQGKRYLSSNDKYYLSDHSFKYAKLGTKNADYGRMIENIVAIELMRRGYELYAGVLYKKEIDFVAIKRSEKLYIKVAGSIDDPDTFWREVDPLLKIKDAYPKMILTRTRQEAYQYEGVQIVDVADWLVE